MTVIGILVASIVGLTVISLFFGLWSLLPKENMTERMHGVIRSDITLDTGGGRSLMLSPKQALAKVNQELLSRGFGQGLTANLVQADLKISAMEYTFITIGITVLGGLLGYTISGHPVSVLVAAVICFFLPSAFVKWRKAKRHRLFSEQLPDALAQVAGSLRAGYSLAQSLDVVAQQMPWPSSVEFIRVVREIQLGQPLSTALEHLLERSNSEDLVMVISAINIHQQVGGNLASILDTVAETIRERVRIKREVQVLTAQQRISAYVLIALPIGLAAVLLILNPEYEMRLFTPGLTLCIPSGALISIMVGYVIMRRIVDIEV